MSLVECHTAAEVFANAKAVRARMRNLGFPQKPIDPPKPKPVKIHEDHSYALKIEVLSARLSTLERSFAKLINTNPLGIDGVFPAEPTLRRPRIHDVKLAVVEHYGFTINELDGKSRTAAVCHVRQIAQHLARRLTLQSLPEIGRRFGGRDHTTLLHADRKIKAARENDKAFDDELLAVEAKIMSRFL